MKRNFSIVHLIVGILSIIVAAPIALLSLGRNMYTGLYSSAAPDLKSLASAEGFFVLFIVVAAVFCFVNLTLRKRIFTILSMIFYTISLFALPYYNYLNSQLGWHPAYSDYTSPTTIYIGMLAAGAFIIALIISFIYNFKKYRK